MHMPTKDYKEAVHISIHKTKRHTHDEDKINIFAFFKN